MLDYTALGWSMGETYMTLGVPMIFAMTLIGGGIAHLFSLKWSNRIGGFGLLSLIGWMIFALMLWDKPWPPR